MSNEYTFQLNVKLGKGYDAHLINITGVAPTDFKENLKWVTENAGGIAAAAAALEAAYGVKELANGVTATQVTNTQPQQQYQQPAVQQAPPNPGPVPSCQHGAMVLRPAGVAKGTGKAYNAFYSCTAGRDSGCRSVNT